MIYNCRPLGDVLSNIVRPNRKIPQDRKGPIGPRPGHNRISDERYSLNQQRVPEFYPEQDRPKRPKRRPQNVPNKGFSLSNPFKDLLNRSPLKHPNHPPKRRPPPKGDNFRPPSKVFNGFAPSFKGSLSLEEARRQYEKDQRYPPQSPEPFDGPRPDSENGERRRKKRRKPGAPKKKKRFPQKDKVPSFNENHDAPSHLR